uniref:Uncharacterized protein n=1 Tax=Hanusia phi TaxID=3032 RepID=A0A7S0EHJ4_9CRYP|mmetsp:Transcript_23635/g.53090  ORF Transcript_23635/g.53090 Transcript_23635/m.53090 type:complete len:119 (+) Transcript_23635:221-577(+)
MCRARAHDNSAGSKTVWTAGRAKSKSKTRLQCSAKTSHGQVNRKQPRAGQYPTNFSPYKMTGTRMRFTCLDRQAALDDIALIREKSRHDFKSIYFEESKVAAHNTNLETCDRQLVSEC